MGAGMKRAREEPVSLALALTTESTSSCTTSADSSGAAQKKRALGGHRTSHLRGRHGLELGVGVSKAIRDMKRSEDKQSHECHNCGLGFETGQALGGHMRRHREEMALSGVGADDQCVWRSVALPGPDTVGLAADRPPVFRAVRLVS
ncbi:hypothetical protein ACQ4PT_002232 [Festuca glaucescens]